MTMLKTRTTGEQEAYVEGKDLGYEMGYVDGDAEGVAAFKAKLIAKYPSIKKQVEDI